MKDEEDRTTEKEVVSVDHTRAEELTEGIDGDNNNGNGILIGRDTPLKELISTSKKGESVKPESITEKGR